MITGIPGHRIEDVKISGILVQHPGGGTKKDAEIQLGEKEKEYPEPTMFGTTPAHGLILRHVTGVEVCDFKVVTTVTDARPCVIVDDVEGSDFSNIKAERATDAPLFVLNEVKDFQAERCGAIADTKIAEAKRKEL